METLDIKEIDAINDYFDVKLAEADYAIKKMVRNSIQEKKWLIFYLQSCLFLRDNSFSTHLNAIKFYK